MKKKIILIFLLNFIYGQAQIYETATAYNLISPKLYFENSISDEKLKTKLLNFINEEKVAIATTSETNHNLSLGFDGINYTITKQPESIIIYKIDNTKPSKTLEIIKNKIVQYSHGFKIKNLKMTNNNYQFSFKLIPKKYDGDSIWNEIALKNFQNSDINPNFNTQNDAMQLEVSNLSENPIYVTFFEINSRGEVSPLLPNPNCILQDREMLIEVGQTIRFDQCFFSFVPPYESLTIKGFASKTPVNFEPIIESEDNNSYKFIKDYYTKMLSFDFLYYNTEMSTYEVAYNIVDKEGEMPYNVSIDKYQQKNMLTELNETRGLLFQRKLTKNDLIYLRRLKEVSQLYIDMSKTEKFKYYKDKYIENLQAYYVSENSLDESDKLIELKEKKHQYYNVLRNIKNSFGKNHSDYGNRLNDLAELHQSMGEYKDALRLYSRALKNVKKSLGKEDPKYGIITSKLAKIYHVMGEYEKALQLYLQAHKIIISSFGRDNSSYGASLNNLATLYRSKGDYEKALPLYLQAIENTENTLGKLHSNYGLYLNNLARLHQSMGEYEKALPLYLDALENAKNALGREHSFYGIPADNLAKLYLKMGEFEKALPLFLEALINREYTLGKEHSLYGESLNNLAELYRNMGEYQKALPLILEALENTENSLSKDHPNFGNSLNDLALLYQSKGEHQKALPLFENALKNTEKALGKEHPDYGNRLKNLANLYQSMGYYQKALPLLINFNYNIQNQINQNFSFQSEEGKEKFIQNNIGDNLKSFSDFNFSTKNAFIKSISLATNNILIDKGLLLNASKNILTNLKGLNEKNINKKINLFRGKKSFVTQQLQQPLNKRATNFTAEKENLETLERELVALYSSHFNEDINYVKDWKETALNEHELAIEFTHFKHNNKKGIDSTMYVAYLYKKDWKTPKVINLFEEKQLTKYFSSTNNPNTLYASRGSIATSTKAKLAVADSIYNLVWKPLEKYVSSNDKIYFSPDGLLHKIPFAALPNKNNQLIGEKYNIQQMGNTADVRVNEKLPNLDDILLIGGVKYDYQIDSTKQKKKFIYNVLESKELLGDTINRSISRNGFDYLKGTEKEIFKIDSLLGDTKLLSGYNATETAFKKISGKSPSVLHIATHGFFFKKPKKEPKKDRFLGQENTYKQHENPLLRSGLLFANANYAWQNGNNPYEEDDGILTALEISNLDLKNTDIVILSACETGLGDIEGSEGVYGLQRAFKMAGVKTIIMSLWPVPDAETAEFMNLFYTNWKQFNNPKKAFKVAQKQMMNKYRETPEKWAAFVLIE